VPIALPMAAEPSDESSESTRSPSDSEDGNPFLPAPERPWSPSVPAASSTLALRRYNIAARRAEAEQPDHANGSSETQPSLSTEISPQPGTPTLTTPTPASPSKIKSATKWNPFVPGGFVSGVGMPPSSFTDEDSKVSGVFTAQQY
jgi:hypothetical protein